MIIHEMQQVIWVTNEKLGDGVILAIIDYGEHPKWTGSSIRKKSRAIMTDKQAWKALFISLGIVSVGIFAYVAYTDGPSTFNTILTGAMILSCYYGWKHSNE